MRVPMTIGRVVVVVVMVMMTVVFVLMVVRVLVLKVTSNGPEKSYHPVQMHMRMIAMIRRLGCMRVRASRQTHGEVTSNQ